MVTALVVGFVIALAAVTWFAKYQVAVVLRSIADIEQPERAQVIVQEYDDAWIHSSLKDLTLAVSEGIENVARAERRVRASIASAKRRFEAEGYVDPGLEAEEGLLPDDDAGGEQDHGVLTLSNDVEPDDSWLSVPGMRRDVI